MKRLIVAFVLCIICIMMVGCEGSGNTESKTQERTALNEWHEVKTFSGKGNQDTSSFSIAGDRVKITATTTGGHVGTYSGVNLESDNGEYLGPGLAISTEGTEVGYGETIYRFIKPGYYYISVISGVNWKVKVEEYR